MTRYIVCWTDNGIFSDTQMKVFETRDPANWFAQSIQKEYNDVKVYLARKGVFDDEEENTYSSHRRF